MSSPSEQPINAELMVRYLLSELSEEETERLDELSIADDEFSWLLSATENDLIDDYVLGKLSKERRQKFKSLYLSSPGRSISASRLQKVEFAEALLRQQERRQMSEKAQRRAPASFANHWLQFAAVAALLMLLISTYMVYRKAGGASQAVQQAKVQPRREPGPDMQGSKAVPGLPTLSPAAIFVLMPSTRAAGRLPRLVLSSGTAEVSFHLQLEFDEFPSYRVTLTDLASNRLAWESKLLRAVPRGKEREVSVTLTTGLLSSGNYSFELSGIPGTHLPEVIASYPFKLVIR